MNKFLFLCLHVVFAANDYPIVLLHGFLGWGRNEFFGFKYWGGIYGDLEQNLKDQGYTVFTAAVGPVSSNWDRATEAYAQIKGDVVDYGIAHSSYFSHNRYGRNFTGRGLYPQWGEVDSVTGKVNKIHIICHSQGGMDARLLAHLLANGNATEQRAYKSRNEVVYPLFAGEKNWIASVTTICTPHDGTTLATGLTFSSIVKDFVVGLASIAGIVPSTSKAIVYDFKLDQWNLVRKEGENLLTYIDRVIKSKVWDKNLKDISAYDLTPDGSRDTNSYITCEPDVFYLTYTCAATVKALIGPTHLPELTMLPVLWPFALFMGAFKRNGDGGRVPIDQTWFENDGVVNTRSHAGPTIPSFVQPKCQIRPYSNQTVHLGGIFNDMGRLQNWDHLDVNGLGIMQIYPFYKKLAQLLKDLPIVTNDFNVNSDVATSVDMTETISEMNMNATIETFERLNCSTVRLLFDTYCEDATNVETNQIAVDQCFTLEQRIHDDCRESAANIVLPFFRIEFWLVVACISSIWYSSS